MWTLFGAALALRLAAIWVLGTWTLESIDDPSWGWGYEQAGIAQALARGAGFSDVFTHGTGPTAWCAPVYPYLLGVILALTGGITPAAALALFVIQSLLSALTAVALFHIGSRVASRRAGLVAGWLYALNPAAMYYASSLVWDTTVVACAITLFLWALVREGHSPTLERVRLLGGYFGVVLVTNPAPAVFLPIVLWYLAWYRPSLRERVSAVVQFVAIAALVCLPWSVRNWVSVGTPGLRSNFGVELMVGNNPGATGSFNARLHPAYNERELAHYRALGEPGYSRHATQKFKDWVSDHPVRFALLTLKRVQMFWIGRDPFEPDRAINGDVRHRDKMGWAKWILHCLTGACALVGVFVMRGRSKELWVMRGTLVVFPVVYYVTHVFERYRFPLESVLVLFCAGAFTWFVERVTISEREVEADVLEFPFDDDTHRDVA